VGEEVSVMEVPPKCVAINSSQINRRVLPNRNHHFHVILLCEFGGRFPAGRVVCEKYIQTDLRQSKCKLLISQIFS
jgi:hypothetical protein